MSLTEAERVLLWEAIDRAFLDTTTYSRDSETEIERAVEHIIAARTSATPPIARPYCLRCEVPIYQDEDGVWRREATGSQVCPRNPAVDGHEPVPTNVTLPAESQGAAS